MDAARLPVPTASPDGELVDLGGDVVHIRPLQSSDRARLVIGFAELGAQSRYRRFFTLAPSLTEGELDRLTDLDHHDREALGAEHAETGRGVGVARYVRDPHDPGCAEFAITVLDDWQRRGVAVALLERLAARARTAGITRFRVEAQADNRAVLGLLRRLGPITLLEPPDHSVVVAQVLLSPA